MTLIVFVLTDKYVVQASDRRVTTMRNGVVTTSEDKAMKTFVLGGSLLMGFTGLAEVSGMPMERWVGQTIAGRSGTDQLQTLRDQIDRHFRSRRELRNVPHLFHVSGFVRTPGKQGLHLRPMGYEIANSSWGQRNGKAGVWRVRQSFTLNRKVLGNQKLICGAIGTSYKVADIHNLTKTLKRIQRLHPDDPVRTFEPIVRFVRTVAASSGGTVGETVITSSIPLAAIPQNLGQWVVPGSADIGSIGKTHPVSLMYPDASTQGVIFLPAVFTGGIQFAGLTITKNP